MQQTRQYILEIFRECGALTVDELVIELKKRIPQGITAVTMRHHLDVLRSENLVTEPTIRRRSTPGRPQYVYTLTDKAADFFPNNYPKLLNTLINQLKGNLAPQQVNVIFEGVADQIIHEAGIAPLMSGLPLPERLDSLIAYLNQHGYQARWETAEGGYILQARNCPYQHVTAQHAELCTIDMRLISGILGVVPRALTRAMGNYEFCSFFIPEPTDG